MADVYDEEKPPAPPVRLTSAKEFSVPVDMRPLPKEPEDEKSRKAKLKALKAKKDKHNTAHHKPKISKPSNFEHTVHVGFDAITGEFTGMPHDWNILLQNSNISKTEQKKNPQAVLDVLNWYDATTKGKDDKNKYMTMNKTLGKLLLCLNTFSLNGSLAVTLEPLIFQALICLLVLKCHLTFQLIYKYTLSSLHTLTNSFFLTLLLFLTSTHLLFRLLLLNLTPAEMVNNLLLPSLSASMIACTQN